MTGGDPAPGLVHDPDQLAGALSRLNRGRRAPDRSPTCLRELLAGFEGLVTALPGGDRGPDAAAAFAELETLLAAQGAGDGAASLRSYLEPILERLVEGLLDYPERRLAAYGSLLPGENNHRHVATLVGRWVPGTVEGTLHDRGWASREGYPGFVHRIPGDRLALKVFESLALPDAWKRLDAFEGAAYRRILAPVETDAGRLVCNIYELTGERTEERAPPREPDRA
ncbi:gamma-glutamylcyclotransferase family protein [Candidatus Palauibacter sp.]|uniref:gamma-glutamylcyclotransferase family protein n=1 Tax=Candidatus Palauibacter sp. TaxID=3101350 RepID=UPI003B5A78E6